MTTPPRTPRTPGPKGTPPPVTHSSCISPSQVKKHDLGAIFLAVAAVIAVTDVFGLMIWTDGQKSRGETKAAAQSEPKATTTDASPAKLDPSQWGDNLEKMRGDVAPGCEDPTKISDHAGVCNYPANIVLVAYANESDSSLGQLLSIRENAHKRQGAVVVGDSWVISCVSSNYAGVLEARKHCEQLSYRLGEGEYIKVDESIQSDSAAKKSETTPAGPKTTFGAGTHLVGVDIVPETYRSSGESCYWERLSGLGGTMSDMITNGGDDGPSIVTIAPTDKAFVSKKRCGTWSLVE